MRHYEFNGVEPATFGVIHRRTEKTIRGNDKKLNLKEEKLVSILTYVILQSIPILRTVLGVLTGQDREGRHCGRVRNCTVNGGVKIYYMKTTKNHSQNPIDD